MEPSVVVQDQLRTATVHHIGPYQGIGEAFARLDEAVRKAGVIGPGTSLVAIYYDDPATVPAANLRSDAGFVMEAGQSPPYALTEKTLPGGQYLRGRHTGSYQGLPATWAHLRGEVLRQLGLRRRPGPSYEVYLNNPTNAAPDALLTDIYIPVE